MGLFWHGAGGCRCDVLLVAVAVDPSCTIGIYLRRILRLKIYDRLIS